MVVMLAPDASPSAEGISYISGSMRVGVGVGVGVGGEEG